MKKPTRPAANTGGITRKDFLNGLAWTAAAAMLPEAIARALDSGPDSSGEEYFLSKGITPQDSRYYPPALTGMRGSHPGSFQVGHALRDGTRWDKPESATDTAEHYDLVIVGGGISGLSAAYFYRKQHGPQSKILILDNHDDFGGHAKRNEFQSGGKTLIGYGGTQSIEVLSMYDKESMGLLEDLGIDIKRFEKYFDRNFRKSHGMGDACFFDKETFGSDRLVKDQVGVDYLEPVFDRDKLQRFVANAPLAAQAQKDLLRMNLEKVDYLAPRTKPEKVALLSKISLQAFLTDYVKVHPDVIRYYQKRPHGVFAAGIESIAAITGLWLLPDAVTEGIGVGESMMKMMTEEPYINHFPDGNASIARLLVRSLVPGCAPGHTMEDIVTARMNYSMLDRPGSAVRIRLNSTVVRAKHNGDPATAKNVDVTYVNAGKAYRVRADHAVLACWNMIIPYLCPELPAKQKEGLSYCVKVPLVYGTVQIRNWQALKKLGVSTAYCPGSYFSELYMDFPVSMGDYRYTSAPDEPCVLHLVRTPCKPGLSLKDQHRIGRAELFATPFATFEHHVHDQLGRMFGAGGFDPARDIEAITINRWPHGYAYGYNPLWDPDWPAGQEPHVIGRQQFGRISIANADSGGVAETSIAISQAYRAIGEITRKGA